MYLQDGGRHCELVWHRRSGKDDLCLHWTAVAAHQRVGNYWHMLPEAAQARKAIWSAINPHTGKRRIDEAFPPEIRKSTNNTEMQITFRNGSVWQLVGSDNFNSLVGSPPIGLVFSEWALCNPASWAYLMPILRENGGWAIFNTTPRGRNHAYRSLASARQDTACFAQTLTAEKSGVFEAKELAEIRAKLIDVYGDDFGESMFRQEYLCSFDAANIGAILGRGLAQAEEDGRVSDAVRYDRAGAPIHISSDIGRRDASAWWFWQPVVGGFRLVDHDVQNGIDAEEWCERLHARIEAGGYDLDKIWLPHDARAKTFSAKHSTIETFLDYFGADYVDITPSVSRADRINAARRVMRRCAFHASNTIKGRDALAAWSYEYNEERKEFSTEPRHDWASHDGDAFSYGAIVMEERQPKIVENPVVIVPEKITLNDLWGDVPRGTATRRISW
jgi:phage terminase large subunit